jgi:hypothetical protein
LAAKGGNTFIVTRYEEPGNVYWNKIAEYGSMLGNTEIMSVARARMNPGFFWNAVARGAARSGNISLLDEAITHNANNFKAICISAARGNQLEILQKYISSFTINKHDTRDIVYAASLGGRGELIETLNRVYHITNWNAVSMGAGAFGNISILELTIKYINTISPECPIEAAQHGYEYVIEWCVKHRFPVDWKIVLSCAAGHGNLDIAKLAYYMLRRLGIPAIDSINITLPRIILNKCYPFT